MEDKKTHKSICADPHVDVNISKIIIHQGFTEESNNMQLVNDIALLRLEHPVNFTSNLHFLIRFDYHDECSFLYYYLAMFDS